MSLDASGDGQSPNCELNNSLLKLKESSEMVETKLKDAEQREKALLKLITEKDMKIKKMAHIDEEYYKVIQELITERDQIILKHENEMSAIKADRDINKQHLESLEITFSDLHAKYETTKSIVLKLKENKEQIIMEKKDIFDKLRLQEERYDKLKKYAMQQFEKANKDLGLLTKENASLRSQLNN